VEGSLTCVRGIPEPDQSGMALGTPSSALIFWRCRMAAIDVFYLGLVLVAMFGFAAALAYYSHR